MADRMCYFCSSQTEEHRKNACSSLDHDFMTAQAEGASIRGHFQIIL